VLIAARYLVDRLRHERTRADEVAALRRRFVRPEPATEEMIALAAELRRLREELVAQLGDVSSCSGCARGHPLPHGRWSGGHCCGTRTDNVFTDDEVAALRLAGTTPARLVPPSGPHAGCAFRGPEGCSLAVADRPDICVRYLCRELEDELRARGDLRAVKAVASSIARGIERFAALRAAAVGEDQDQ
jgi:hypothetical protein